MTNDIAIPPSALRLDAALSFVRRGWPVVPLHDISMGFCSCNDGSEKHAGSSAGKHPIAQKWQFSAITDEEIMRGFMAGRPGMNFGIKTGIQAGLWVLDVDPKHDGDKRLAELVTAHGNLPDTYMQRTGSGGVHYFWQLPGDFTPTNSKGSLPPGLDVRGEGGFVVAAPCVSGIGPYETLMNIPLAQAPGWLLEMIRPRVPADREHSEALEHWDSPVLAGVSDRGQRYAMAAVLAELGKLAGASPGERGFTAYRVACSLVELLNSPWAGLDEDQVKAGFGQAAQRAMTAGGSFDEHEAWAAWGSAMRKVGARGRAAPGSGSGGVLLGWNQLGGVPPFGEAGISGSVNVTEWYTGNSHEFPPVGAAGNPAGQRSNDLFPREFPSIPKDQTSANAVDVLVAKFLDLDALSKIPPPSWLIDDWVVKDSLCWVVGKGNDGKSFVLLDMAMCIALGLPWHGHKTAAGKVGYVVAEGVSGMYQRTLAWRLTYAPGQPVPNIRMLPEPVQAADLAAWDTLIAAVAQMGLDLVVFDTQARVTVGLDENSAKEMGLFVEQVERLRRATGATVILVHHLDKSGRSARGSGAMYGAAQTELTVTRADETVTIAVTKQKDGRYAEPLKLQLVDVITGPPLGWADGAPSAGVLKDVDLAAAKVWEGLTCEARVTWVLNSTFPGRGATKAEAKAESLKRGVSQSSFYRTWDEMLTRGKLVSVLVDDKVTGRYVLKTMDD